MRKHICSKCGKEFEGLNNYAYGLSKGRAFVYKLCDECAKNISSEEEKDLEEKSLILNKTQKD